MLARLLAYCVEQIALDGEQGTNIDQLFEYAARAFENEKISATIDSPYREYIWKSLLAKPQVYVGVAAERKSNPVSRGRTSVLGKAPPESHTPVPIESGTLASLCEQHGDALRVAIDPERVRQMLTGTCDVSYLSSAAYFVLQQVSRARSHGVTVVEIGKSTGYDQKTVFYLVKALIERDLVYVTVKFLAPEMGHVSNYIVCKAYLTDNPLWRAQQGAQSSTSEGGMEKPVWQDVDRLASLDHRESDDEDESVPDSVVEGTMDEDTRMLAFPLLADEQCKVWLHSRQDLLQKRLAMILEMSPSCLTPRRLLATRLGLRPRPDLKRAFIAFLNRLVAKGYIERVRLQLGNSSPMYLQSNESGIRQMKQDDQLQTGNESEESLESWTLVRERSVENQIIDYISQCGKKGCTLNDLAIRFHASTDVKRMIEQILSKQLAPPFTPHTICSPFEQQGRERRIRYYTFAGFQQRCEDDDVDLATALGMTPSAPIPRAVAPLPPTLPSEMRYEQFDQYLDVMNRLHRREIGLFRDSYGPVILRKRKTANVDPVTGQPKRGRPRKVKQEAADADSQDTANQPTTATDVSEEITLNNMNTPSSTSSAAPLPMDDGLSTSIKSDSQSLSQEWSQLQPELTRLDTRRTNMSEFQRTTMLISVLEQAGGALDELEVPRMLQNAAGSDLSDRTTRSKVVQGAKRRGLLRTVKVQRATGDAHRQRTILYLPSLSAEQLQSYVQDVVQGRSSSRAGVTKHTDLVGEETGLIARGPSVLPWATTEKVVAQSESQVTDSISDTSDAQVHSSLAAQQNSVLTPENDPRTRQAFAKVSHVLRSFYGFYHGAATRLQLFHQAALSQPTNPVFTLEWFWTECPLWTYVALVPVKLRSRTVVRAVLNNSARKMPVSELSGPVAQRLGLRRIKEHEVRFQSYAEQLVALGAAVKHDDDSRYNLVTELSFQGTVYDLRTPESVDLYWQALRERYAPRFAAKPNLQSEETPSGSEAVAPIAFLSTHHAWQNTYQLHRPQKIFLRRYSQQEPTDELIARLAYACLAPVDSVAAFLRTPARTAKRPGEVLQEKVATRRAQRETEFDAMLHALQAEHDVTEHRRPAVDRLIAQHRRRYVGNREGMTPAELQSRLRTTLIARPSLRETVAPRRRVRQPTLWTSEFQEYLRDAFIILYEEYRQHGSEVHPMQLDNVIDLSILQRLAGQSDDSSSVKTMWRARWKQLLHSSSEQTTLRSLVRAWAPIAANARKEGLINSIKQADDQQDILSNLQASIAYLRAHLDKPSVLAQQANARKANLPRKLTTKEIAQWQIVAERTSLALPNMQQPMIHRLQTQCRHARSMKLFQAPEISTQLHFKQHLADAVVRCLPTAQPGAAERVASLLGASEVDAAIGRLIQQKVVRMTGERQGLVQLAYTDEYHKLVSQPIPASISRDAQQITQQLGEQDMIVAQPSASDGQTAAYIAWLDQSFVKPELDFSPLHELRKRTQLNARTLDDVETECCINLHRNLQLDSRSTVHVPCQDLLDGSTPSCPINKDLEHLLSAPDGIPITALNQHSQSQVEKELLSTSQSLFVAGYDQPRVIARQYLPEWTLPAASEQHRFFPCIWRDPHGNLRNDLWKQRLSLLSSWCVARPSITLSHLLKQLSPAVDRMELVQLVEALADAEIIQIRASGLWYLTPDAQVSLLPGPKLWFMIE
ncbi:oxalate--CoA ligase [Malassezia psittaci]|uniref:Oxalate--CoA ligase n=1 Tax=Malassezia psittaci TaxID=1821823 RepID=A0AAF0F379_9BASI|nr:oxalate--CoA ligase [Malassezia psittaci]